MSSEPQFATPSGERLRFERLLVDLATLLVSLGDTELESGISEGLARIRKFLGADRGTIFELSSGQTALRSTHSSIGPGIPRAPASLSTDEFGWLAGRLLADASTIVTRIEDLPEEALGERAYLRASGIKSSVVVPLVVGGAVLGAVVFSWMTEERTPQASLAPRLRLVGDIFGLALARARGETQMRRQRDELARITRVMTVGELTVTLAHELSQPLTAILSNAQAAQRLLGATDPDLAEVREALADIVDDNRRAGAVIARLRGLMGTGAREATRFALDGVVRDVIELLRGNALDARVSVTLDLGSELPPVRGDIVALQQVVLNLAMNAFDAMRHVQEGPRELQIRTARSASDAITTTLCDTGSGPVGKEIVDRLFEPFFSTKPDGLGVGLSVCRSIVADHGGRLWATPNTDRGMTFQFTLPVG